MDLSFFIAKRYLFSKKSVNAIHFISGVSVLGVFVGSAALIIILSVFNGFEQLVLSLYNNFTPELRIEPAVGKTFNPDHFRFLKEDDRIDSYTEVLQEKALLRYGNSQFVSLVRGVSDDYFKGKQLNDILLEGKLVLKDQDTPFALISAIVQNYLSVNIENDFQSIEIYSPQKGVSNLTDPRSEVNIRAIHPIGILQPQQHFEDLIIVPLTFAKDLFNEFQEVSMVEFNLKQGVIVEDFQKEIAKRLGSGFVIKNRTQQNELLYKILNSEKWAVFLILTFVLLIAIFNIIGSLTMLVIDKRKDIAILNSLGASKILIRKIFFIEGMLISMVGCLIGMGVGLVFCLLQQQYGFIKIGQTNFLTDAYPIALKWTNFVLVFVTVASISTLASFISSQLSIQHLQNVREDL